MSKVTIIVPIYNVEEYVAKCLDSLLRQTYSDYVIYAVNDGSPKNEQPIINRYAAAYPEKVVAIRKENGGYGSVLEMAIARLDSEYFLVCDPDDYLADDALETLVGLADANQADLVIGAKNFIYSDSDEQKYDPAYNTKFATLQPGQGYVKGTPEFENLLFVDPSPHAKLYRRSLAANIQFPHKIGYTDNLLFYISLLNAEKVVYTDKALAYYLIDRAGNTMTDLKPQVIDAHAQVFSTILDQAERCSEVPALFYYRIFEAYKFSFYQLRRIKGTPAEKLEHAEVLYRLVEKLMPHRAAILEGMTRFGYTGSRERMKDKLVLTAGVSHPIYRRWVKSFVKE